ncbi:type 12 methyltransferase [Patiriisocius marinus]|uniref:Type 12 methyltransferase n=1 Tax=Patiriisocius marinus TaxID=1397112 RepID=A0A5J4IPX3_9FLAO|nr:class I SAM-dependent methyltransferase [Patiriisocius marinus]GER59799.1 type 12 methyltransferase [Patiriisocius marinus]
MTDLTKAFNLNKETWNKRIAQHVASDFYDVAGFKKGQTSLNIFELKALGDVVDKSILHLQCHFGQDTLSWSRMGATCTGVDISDAAIAYARTLNDEISEDATFVCCNVLDVAKHIDEKFDIVFTSYGTIGWLPDLKPWAQMIAERLKPGGVFYIVDFHPIAWMFDYTVSPPVMKYGYQQREAIYEEYTGSYAAPDADFESKEYGWNHSLGEVVSSLANAGLTIEFLKEYEQSPYNVFPDLVTNKNGLYELPSKLYPLLFEVKAVKDKVFIGNSLQEF